MKFKSTSIDGFTQPIVYARWHVGVMAELTLGTWGFRISDDIAYWAAVFSTDKPTAVTWQVKQGFYHAYAIHVTVDGDGIILTISHMIHGKYNTSNEKTMIKISHQDAQIIAADLQYLMNDPQRQAESADMN